MQVNYFKNFVPFYRNRCEYVAVLATICITAFAVFYNYYFRTVNSNNKKSEQSKKLKVK